MRAGRTIALLATGLLAGTGLLARAPAPLTRITVRAMAPETLTRRLFGDLSPIMLPIPHAGRGIERPGSPLQRLHFVTRSFATAEPGICGTNLITVYFEPAGPLRGPRTSVRPQRIGHRDAFFVRDLAAIRQTGPITDAERSRLEASCAGLDPRTARWLAASNPYDVARTARLVADLVDAARTGHPLAPITCADMAVGREVPLSAAECLQLVARLDPSKIWEVRGCDVIRNCLRTVVDAGIAISFELPGGTGAPVRITVEPNIVLTG